jgi:hypothetical protein
MEPTSRKARGRREVVAAALTASLLALFPPPAPSAARADEARASGAAIAVAGPVVRVHAGTAQLVVNCHNAPCEGVAKLVAQLPRSDRPPRRAPIGSAAFAIPAESERVLRIALNRQGRHLMRRAKANGRYCLLEGPGLRHRTVVLKRVRAFPPR